MAFCSNCGTQAEGAFCPGCGKPIGAAAPPPAGGGYAPPPPPSGGYAPPGAMGDAGLTEPVASGLCYVLGFITGIIFLVLEPYNRSRNVRFHAFQSIFLNVAMIGGWIVLTIVGIALNVIPVLGTILMVVLWFAYMIATVGIWLYMLIKTFGGEKIVLPVIGPLAEKQVNG